MSLLLKVDNKAQPYLPSNSSALFNATNSLHNQADRLYIAENNQAHDSLTIFSASLIAVKLYANCYGGSISFLAGSQGENLPPGSRHEGYEWDSTISVVRCLNTIAIPATEWAFLRTVYPYV